MANELPRVITALSLEPWVKEFAPYNSEGKNRLQFAAEAFGVDMKKIAAELGTSMRTEFNAKRKKSQDKKAAEAKKADAPKAKKGVKAAPPVPVKTAAKKPTPKPEKKAAKKK